MARNGDLRVSVEEREESPQGRERLIEAAIELYARDGFDATSVRALAEKAGVSWGLVRFYFGSKDGLRAAAEERVVKTYIESARAGAKAPNSQLLDEVIGAYSGELPRVAKFLRRAIVEGRPIALTFLRQLMATEPGISARVHAEHPSEDWLVDPIRDAATRLGYLMLAPQFQEILGRDVFSREELKKRNSANLRMYELIRLGLEAETAKTQERPKERKSAK